MSAVQDMQDAIRRTTADARERFVGDIPSDQPDAIVAALGGSFEKQDEYGFYGGHDVIVLVGANRREAVIQATNGRMTNPVRIFEPRLRAV